MTSEQFKMLNRSRNSKGRFEKKSKQKTILLPSVMGEDFDDEDFVDELPDEVLSEVKDLDKVMKAELTIEPEIENSYAEKEESEDDEETEEDVVEIITETEALVKTNVTETLSPVEIDQKRLLKAMGKQEKKDCPVDKSIIHSNPLINLIKMKIGVKPLDGKGRYAKNELQYLISDVVDKNGYKDVNNKLEEERCWKQINDAGIECSKTQFRERWTNHFKLMAI